MKGIKAVGMMLATLFFVACSDNINTEEGMNTGDGSGSTDGYVKVSINMPTTSSNSRAMGNYQDGVKSEYQVNNALIVFFGGENEQNATFLNAYPLELGDMKNDNNNEQVTTTSEVCILEAPSVPTGTNLYALAVINPNGILSIDGENNLLLDGSPAFSENNNTVKALQNKIEKTVSDFISTSENEKASFFMTNAPLSDKSASSENKAEAKATTLVKVKVYKTEADAKAENAVADPIFVERIVAKVSMEISSSIKAENSDNTINVSAGNIYNGDQVTLDGWVLNATNKSTKLVRDVSGLSQWVTYDSGNSRFLASGEVKKDARVYRIFWAIDNNYDSKYDADDFTIYANSTSNIPWNTSWDEDKNGEYCLENTFSTAHQRKNETTSVLIKGTYKRSEEATAKSFFIVGNNGELLTEQEFIEKVKSAANLTGNNIIMNADAQGGYYNMADGKKLNELLNVESDDAAKLQDVITALGTVKYYRDGATYYYTTLIKHFGESETPWEPGESYTEEKHLGRYGVVRNTWYQLSIDGISGPGEPEIPDLPDEPDDTVEGYIKVSVNILSWAVRTQGVDL